MNERIRRSSLLAAMAVAAGGIAAPTAAWGAHPAYDNAADAAYNSGWSHGADGGFGFGAWALSGGSNAGFFIGNSANNGSSPSGNVNTSGEAFGLFANNGGVSSAVRTFDGGALQPGQSFSIRMDNGFIDTGGTVGIGLQNASETNRIEFFFVGGQSDYKVNNASTSTPTAIGFTDGGLRLRFTIAGGNQIRVVVRDNDDTSTLFDQLIAVANDSDITRFRLFNANAGNGGQRDAYFNEMAVPEPGAASGVAVIGMVFAGPRRRRRGRSPALGIE